MSEWTRARESRRRVGKWILSVCRAADHCESEWEWCIQGPSGYLVDEGTASTLPAAKRAAEDALRKLCQAALAALGEPK